MLPINDFRLNLDMESILNVLFELILAYWDPKPTNKPATISLNEDVFCEYLSESYG